MAEPVDELGIQDVNLVKNLNRSVFAVGRQTQKKSLVNIIRDIKQDPSQENLFKIIDSLTDIDLMGILNLVYRKNSAGHFSKSEHALLDAAVILVCIRTLIKKWDGFPKMFTSGKSEKCIADRMVKYLKHNLNYVFSKKDTVLENLKRDDPNINLINEYEQGVVVDSSQVEKEVDGQECDEIKVECSYNKLKSVFIMDSGAEDETIINYCEDVKSQGREQLFFQLPQFAFTSLFNWSFVSVTLNTPDYKVLYKNCHKFDYKLVKFYKGYKPTVIKINESVTSKYVGVNQYETETRRQYETVIARELCEYLGKVWKVDRTKQNETFDCFDSAVKRCGSVLKTCWEYTVPSKITYVRYLGQFKNSKSGGPVIQHDKQKYINQQSELNIRLQETIQPTIKLYIIKQDHPNIYNKISLEFHCTLCKISFSGPNGESNMKRHLIVEHGQEPDWFCVKCDQSFTMKKLTMETWYHNCYGRPSVISMKPLQPSSVVQNDSKG